jgi:hypothetical protein
VVHWRLLLGICEANERLLAFLARSFWPAPRPVDIAIWHTGRVKKPGFSNFETKWVYRFTDKNNDQQCDGGRSGFWATAPAIVPVADRSARVAPQQSPVL